MTNEKYTSPTSATFAPSLRGRLLQCAAASAAAWVLLPSAAHAAIPPECDEQMNPNLITCVVPEPDTLDPVDVSQDNTTIVIGSTDTPTELVADAENGIVLSGNGAQTVVVNSGSSVASAQGDGIVMEGEGLLSTIVAADASVLAAGGNGVEINMNGLDGGIDVLLSGSVLASDDGVRLRNFGDSGETTLVIRNGASITGQNGNGVDVITIAGGLDIDTSDASVSGEQRGISAAVSSLGGASILTGDVTGAQDDGIFVEVQAAVGSVLVDSSAGTVTGGANGIQLDNDSTQVSVQITTAGVNGNGANGILVENEGTDLLVDTSAGLVTANGTGLLIEQQGTGETAIQTAAVRANDGAGIEVNASATATDLLVTTDGGLVSGGTFGISLDHDGSGMLALTTAGVVGENADGISVNNAGTTLAINSIQGSVDGLASGINAIQNGSGIVSIQTADVSGMNGFGIFALNNTGAAMTITSTDGTISGALSGISAQHDGSGALTITTASVAAGEDGISAETSALSNGLSIDTSAGSIESGIDGIFAEHGGTGATSVVTGNVTSETGVGIAALNSADGDGVTVDTSAGSVSAASIGLAAGNLGTGDLSVTTGNVTSAQEIAIQVANLASGDGVFLDTTAGSVSGATNGISANNQGSFGMTIATGDVSGADGALLAFNDGSGDLTITTANLTSSQGAGVTAFNGNGSFDLLIDTSAGVINAATNGIQVVQESSGSVTIISGDVSSGEDGIAFQSGGDTFITNQGQIESGGFEIFADPASVGAVEITNNGTIVGTVSLGIDADIVTNSGTYRALGDSAFGEGDDLFTNNGVLEASGIAAFTDLEQLANNGSIVMADGSFGDALQLSGDYVGTGGRLALDVDLGGAGGTDVLVVDGAATGSTVIDPSIEGQALAFGGTTLLVDAGDGTTADAFALAGGDTVTEGFLAFNLSFDAANNDFLLDSAIGPTAFRTLKIGEGALSSWYRSADAWDAHIDSRRHNPNVEGPLWLQLYGATSERDDNFDFTSSGFTQDIALDYDQDFFGFQMGAEFGPATSGDGAFYGVTAGYQSSNIDFDAASDGIDYDVFNLGAYAGYQEDAFFAHALVKYDFINAEMDGQSIGYTADVDGGSIGVRAEAGYRWETGSLFVEPSASLEYQSTSLDDFSALGASFELENLDGLRGIAGVRLGGDSKVGNDTVLTYYGSASVVHEFAGEGEALFSTPLSSATLVNNPIGTFGRFDLGLDVTGQSGVSGFVEGSFDLSGDYTSVGARAGLRIRF